MSHLEALPYMCCIDISPLTFPFPRGELGKLLHSPGPLAAFLSDAAGSGPRSRSKWQRFAGNPAGFNTLLPEAVGAESEERRRFEAEVWEMLGSMWESVGALNLRDLCCTLGTC